MKCIIGNKKRACGFGDELKVSQDITHSGILFLLSILLINNAPAGGLGFGVTQLIYPAENKQITLSVQSSGDNTSYLVQPWADDSKTEKKSQDFVIAPPLFMLPMRKEASLCIMFSGRTNLPTDCETLYWTNAKVVPPINEKNTQKNTLQLTSQSKIRLFCRPENPPVQPGKARNTLRFRYKGKQLEVINPSSYYLTLTGTKV